MSYYGNNIPDHPVIRNLERTGYPDGKEPEYPHCPNCGQDEVSEVYVQKEAGTIGCESCITRKSAENFPACEQKGHPYPVCPVCGKDCETVYLDCHGNILGCDECVTEKDAWEQTDCFHDNE